MYMYSNNNLRYPKRLLKKINLLNEKRILYWLLVIAAVYAYT